MPKRRTPDTAANKLVAIRLTEFEHATYTAAATADNLTLSAWLRWLAEQRVKQQRKRK